MEYKDLIKKIAKMHNYYTDDGSACSDDCPLVGSNGLCKANHSIFYFAGECERGLSEEIDRIVTEWKQPIDWEAITERAKTEDIKVLVWDDNPSVKKPRYLASYGNPPYMSSTMMFEAFESGTTRWSNESKGTSWWKHAELVEEEGEQ